MDKAPPTRFIVPKGLAPQGSDKILSDCGAFVLGVPEGGQE